MNKMTISLNLWWWFVFLSQRIHFTTKTYFPERACFKAGFKIWTNLEL